MTPLIYALDNERLGKVEHLALAVLDGLSGEFVPYVFAPEGDVIKEARKMGFTVHAFTGLADFVLKLRAIIVKNSELHFISADSKFTSAALFLNFFYRCRTVHLQLVTEDLEGNLSLGKPNRFNKSGVTFVALSKSIREKLIAGGARHERIRVIENFLSERTRNKFRRRRAFQTDGIKKVSAMLKGENTGKIELLFAAIDRAFELRSLKFTIYTDVSPPKKLRHRVAADYPNVVFEELCENNSHKLSEADLYLHLCRDESANLSILTALAANVPVLVPESDAGTIISHNINGFSYLAEDAASLAARLTELSTIDFDLLNAIAKGGRHLLNIKFSSENGVEKYRRLLRENNDLEIDFARGKVML